MISNFHIEQIRFADIVIETEWRQHYFAGCARGVSVPQLHLTTYDEYVVNRTTHQIILNSFCQQYWRAPYSTVAWSPTCYDQAGFVCTYDATLAYDYCHTWDEIDTITTILNQTCDLRCDTRVGILDMSPPSTPFITARPDDTAAYNDHTRHTFNVTGVLPANLFITVYIHADYEYVRAPHIVTLAWVDGDGIDAFMCEPVHFVREGAIIAITHNITNHKLTGTQHVFGFLAYNFYGDDTFKISVAGAETCQDMQNVSLLNTCVKHLSACDIPIIPVSVQPERRTNQYRIMLQNMSLTMIGISFVLDECGTVCTPIMFVNMYRVNISERAFTLNITNAIELLTFSNDSVYLTAYGDIGRVSAVVIEQNSSCSPNFIKPIHALTDDTTNYQMTFDVPTPIKTHASTTKQTVYEQLYSLAVENNQFLSFEVWNYSMPTIHNNQLFFPATYWLLVYNFNTKSNLIVSNYNTNYTLSVTNCAGGPETAILWYYNDYMPSSKLELTIIPATECSMPESEPLLCDAPFEIPLADVVGDGYQFEYNTTLLEHLIVTNDFESRANRVCKPSYLDVRATEYQTVIDNTRIVNDAGIQTLLVQIPCTSTLGDPITIGIVDTAFLSSTINTIRLNGPTESGTWAPPQKPKLYGWRQCKLFTPEHKPHQVYWALELPSKRVDSGHYVTITNEFYDPNLITGNAAPQNVTVAFEDGSSIWKWAPQFIYSTITIYNIYADLTCNILHGNQLLGIPFTDDRTLRTIPVEPTLRSESALKHTGATMMVPILIGGIPLTKMPYNKIVYENAYPNIDFYAYSFISGRIYNCAAYLHFTVSYEYNDLPIM
jgi:hypothetical protein